jgi:hypothetical protein
MASTTPSKIENPRRPHEIENNFLNFHHLHNFLNPLLCVYDNRVEDLSNANEK